jgi:hypothetical protein
MPVIVDTYIKDGETINVYESGAHYNVTRKHLVRAPESAMITKENVGRFKEQLAEKKREAIIKGAGRVLERSGDWEAPNNLDVAEAIAEAVMLKALNPDNPKQVDAARFILQEGGMAETQTKANEGGQQFGDLAGAARNLLSLLRAAHDMAAGGVGGAPGGSGSVIDATAQDLPALTDDDNDTRNE